MYLQLPQAVGAVLQAEEARHPFVICRGYPHALFEVDEHLHAFKAGHGVADGVEPEVKVAGVALLEVVLALKFGGVPVGRVTGFVHPALMVADLDPSYLGQALGQ